MRINSYINIVNSKMKSPCEIAVWFILPQIRAGLARELVRQGLSQKETAEKLKLTPAAVLSI